MIKTNLTAKQKADYVKEVFRRVAPRYDMMNRLMTAGFDRHWKKQVIALTDCQKNQQVLDLGSGTGDLARMILKNDASLNIIAADFSLEMMLSGRLKGNLTFLNADGMQLPFCNKTFDRVVSGYLLRNVGNIDTALSEIYRVLKNGGKYVVLDTTRPRKNLFSPLIHFYMHRIIPWVGGLISGYREAYEYLPDSSEQFLTAEALAEKLKQAGFTNVIFKRYMFGTVAIHSAEKII